MNYFTIGQVMPTSSLQNVSQEEEKSDLDTDDELELFSESESEDYEEIPKLNI